MQLTSHGGARRAATINSTTSSSDSSAEFSPLSPAAMAGAGVSAGGAAIVLGGAAIGGNILGAVTIGLTAGARRPPAAIDTGPIETGAGGAMGPSNSAKLGTRVE